jgi:hypothetical protein
MPNYAAREFPDPETLQRLQKPRPKLLEKRDVASKRDAKDRLERAKCRARSLGQCEVYERVPGMRVWVRCAKRALENHHLIGGRMRNRGKSILAEHRLDVCPDCHQEITGNVLKPEDGTKRELASDVRYERIR